MLPLTAKIIKVVSVAQNARFLCQDIEIYLLMDYPKSARACNDFS